MKGFAEKSKTFEGIDRTVSEKANAHGVTTRVNTVATVKPTTNDPAICSQKLVMYDPVFIVLSIRSMLYPRAIGNRPAIVVKEVKKTGLNLSIALLRAKDFVEEPGLFLFRRLKVSIKTILLLTTIPARATQLIPVCNVLKDLSSTNRDIKTPPNDKRIADKTILA